MKEEKELLEKEIIKLKNLRKLDNEKYEEKIDNLSEEITLLKKKFLDYNILLYGYPNEGEVSSRTFSKFDVPHYAFYKQVLYVDNLLRNDDKLIRGFKSYQKSSDPFNYSLRAGKLNNKPNLVNLIKGMDQVFEDIPPVNFDFFCYRGTNDYDFLEDVGIGEIVVDKGFVSTSLSKQVTTKFIKKNYCCEYVIFVPKNAKVVPLWTIELDDYDYSGQKELLFPRNSRFQYIGNLPNYVYSEIYKDDIDPDYDDLEQKEAEILEELKNVDVDELEYEDLERLDAIKIKPVQQYLLLYLPPLSLESVSKKRPRDVAEESGDERDAKRYKAASPTVKFKFSKRRRSNSKKKRPKSKSKTKSKKRAKKVKSRSRRKKM